MSQEKQKKKKALKPSHGDSSEPSPFSKPPKSTSTILIPNPPILCRHLSHRVRSFFSPETW
ncbi:hypothetical protein F383_29901 [Gossypium arboreum]|uniref:Uncharacterized protein n=1 Tax=Gossypium arboreum TaxID=29729 RepID=A0A0B0MYN9_GOSAR|nr:hypothetical protein F383_29901 [Gossypium arboreum]